MSKNTDQLSLRDEVLDLYRKHRAIMILTNSLDRSERQKTEEELAELQHANREQLREYKPKLRKMVAQESKKFGVRASLYQMEKAIDSFPPPKPNQTRFHLRVFQLDEMFEHYDKVVKNYREFPPHAMISVDILGIQEKRESYWYVLEQVLFIGMAMHWNDICHARNSNQQSVGRREFALLHSTVRAAFALIEAYINNLAFDVRLTRSDLTTKELEALAEWTECDENEYRPKYVSLKNKLLKYPRIALRRQHPIFNENNCPEFKTTLEFQDKYRDSVTHPTSRLTPAEIRDGLPSREHNLWNLDLDVTRDICDSVVELIFIIDKELNGMFGSVSMWLDRRGKDGFFPKDKLE